eukprot:g4242.t1
MLFPGCTPLFPGLALTLLVGHPLIARLSSHLADKTRLWGTDANGFAVIGVVLVLAQLFLQHRELGPNLFEVLHIDRFTEHRQIVTAYRRLMKQAIRSGDEELSKQLRAAFNVVADHDNARFAYEQYGPEVLLTQGAADVSHLLPIVYVYGVFAALNKILTQAEPARDAGAWLTSMLILLLAGDASVRFLSWSPKYQLVGWVTPHEFIVYARAIYPTLALLVCFWKRVRAVDSRQQQRQELRLMRRHVLGMEEQLRAIRTRVLGASGAAGQSGNDDSSGGGAGGKGSLSRRRPHEAQE